MKELQHFRLNRLLASGLAGLGLCLFANSGLAIPPDATIDMKLLVLTKQKDNENIIDDAYDLEATKAILDRLGIPYDVFVYDPNNTQTGLPPLETTNTAGAPHALYQGIILPDSPYEYLDGNQPLAQEIQRFQFKYGVRMLALDAWPTDTGCLTPAATRSFDATPLSATLTPDGTANFSYLNAGSVNKPPLPLKYTTVNFATPVSSSTDLSPTADIGVKPLLRGDDGTASGTLLALCQFADKTYTGALALDSNHNPAREILAGTFANSSHLLHSMALSYGLINWVTKGVFLGERHVFLNPQPDDIGIPDDIWPWAYDKFDPSLPEQWYNLSLYRPDQPALGATGMLDPDVCPAGPRNKKTGLTPCEYRLTGNDLKKVVSWQTNFGKTYPSFARAIRIEWPFNGYGFTTKYGGSGAFPNDSLSPAVASLASNFRWISHTYDHELMEAMAYGSPTTPGTASWELQKNQAVRNSFPLPNYARDALVTPEISGLYTADVLRAMVDFGVTTVVSDTSKPTPYAEAGQVCSRYESCQNNTGSCSAGDGYASCDMTLDKCVPWPQSLLPLPNSGKANCVNPAIYEVPRYPTALYYNVSTPKEWVEEYNHFYGAGGTLCDGCAGVDADIAKGYPELLDRISDVLLGYLLTYDLRPLMFHQANLRAYDGTHSLLGDLIGATLAKYNDYYKDLPIVSPGLKDIGNRMMRRQVYLEAKDGKTITDPNKVLKAVLTPAATGGGSMTITATPRADGKAIVVPMTAMAGTAVLAPSTSESYGGQTILSITLEPDAASATSLLQSEPVATGTVVLPLTWKW